MKLQSIFESAPDVQALRKAGIECSPREFQENYELIIDFQDRMYAMYDDVEEKLHTVRLEDDGAGDGPQVQSSIFVEPSMHSTSTNMAWWYLDKSNEDYELAKKNARKYIANAFKKFLPELNAVFRSQSDNYIDFDIEYGDTPLQHLDVDFSAPDVPDNQHSNKRRKALKWW